MFFLLDMKYSLFVANRTYTSILKRFIILYPRLSKKTQNIKSKQVKAKYVD